LAAGYFDRVNAWERNAGTMMSRSIQLQASGLSPYYAWSYGGMTDPTQTWKIDQASSGNRYWATQMLGASNPAVYNLMDTQTGFGAFTFDVSPDEYAQQVVPTAAMFGMSNLLMPFRQMGSEAEMRRE